MLIRKLNEKINAALVSDRFIELQILQREMKSNLYVLNAYREAAQTDEFCLFMLRDMKREHAEMAERYNQLKYWWMKKIPVEID